MLTNRAISDFAENYRLSVIQTLSYIDAAKVAQAVGWMKEARDQGKHIFVCGNGGSASTASHFACDIVKGASYNQDKRFRIMALTDSLATLTAYSNDVGYESVFAEQLKNFCAAGRCAASHQQLGQFTERHPRRGICQLDWLPDHWIKRTGRRETGADGAIEYPCRR